MCRLRMIDEGGEDWQSLGYLDMYHRALPCLVEANNKEYEEFTQAEAVEEILKDLNRSLTGFIDR